MKIRKSNQTKTHSVIEVVTSTIIGYVVALLSQIFIFSIVGIDVSFKTNIWLSLWFTFVSIVRGYTVRRIFSRIGG